MIVDYFDEPTKIKIWDYDDVWVEGLGKGNMIYFNNGLKTTIQDYYAQVKLAHLWQEGPSMNKAIIILE